jgi:hypothetical protein
MRHPSGFPSFTASNEPLDSINPDAEKLTADMTADAKNEILFI